LGRERPPGSGLVGATRGRRRGTRGRVAATAAPGAPAQGAEPAAALLEVEGLRIEFLTRHEWLPVMEDASFSLHRGKTLGLVGESGSGKTVTALSVMGLLPARVSRVAGSIRFEHRELTTLDPAGLRTLRGNDI